MIILKMFCTVNQSDDLQSSNKSSVDRKNWTSLNLKEIMNEHVFADNKVLENFHIAQKIHVVFKTTYYMHPKLCQGNSVK